MAEPLIVVISNRNVNPDKTDHELFGEEQNANGWEHLRVATAKFNSGAWSLKLIDDDNDQNPLPSKILFDDIQKTVASGELSNRFVFFIHGNNQTFRKNLNKSRKLANIHNVNVIAFSWPSRPNLGGKKKRFERAKRHAVLSSAALEETLRKIRQYTETCSLNVEFNLLVHSLGNLLFKAFTDTFSSPTNTHLFRRAILHQGSPPNKDHHLWVNRIDIANEVIYTVNRNDKILRYAEAVDPETMGKTRKDLIAQESIYVDFTGGDDVKNKHQLFGIPQGEVFNVMQNLLVGLEAEFDAHFFFDDEDNAWTVRDRVSLIATADAREDMLSNSNPDYNPDFDDPEDKTLDGLYIGLIN